MNRILVSILALIAMVGCVPPVVSMEHPFQISDYAPYEKKGTGVLTGQAFLKTMGGDVKYGAGCTVEVYPMTPYQRERFERKTVMGQNLEPINPMVVGYVHRALADGMGNFEFDDLPEGEYMVVCGIFWSVPNGYIMSRTGGVAYGTATVKNGMTTKIVVTR